MSNIIDYYSANPLTTQPRNRAEADSAWVQSFACGHMRPLIVCRGPIRKEAIDTFQQMGMDGVGILLSEKDSIVYSNALAPELRQLHPDQVHRVADYTGGTREERARRIEEILLIARTFGYSHIFAGYGFMAEDEDFVRAIEDAGLAFIGPCSRTVQAAGQKDEAKRTALREGVSVTPGVNDVTARALLRKHPDLDALRSACAANDLHVDLPAMCDDIEELRGLADAVLAAAYDRGMDLFTVDELGAEVAAEVEAMLRAHPGTRVRLKAIGGGGGKGQRILGVVGDVQAAAHEAAKAPAMLREILGEVKAGAPGDDKNVLIELNIESTRHHEIQLVGNGQWCISLGGRDCSLQMHEQKLLEYSITQEALLSGIAGCASSDDPQAVAMKEDLETLRRMEAEAERFGQAVGLDSASTFECIVDGARHFFMEVNTRIQVEHRVSELCYALRFTNPDDATDWFDVESLVEAMALLAAHKDRLPRPERVIRKHAAVEARLNATNPALSPHAGGMITSWSGPIEGEIRDDQGICLPNPDTGHFIEYCVAGAYDSNIALLVTHGEDRRSSFERLREILAAVRLHGTDLHTNLEFHYGLLNWLLAQGVDARPTTRFISAYLAQVGLLKQEADRLDVWHALKSIFAHYQRRARNTLDGDALRKRLDANATCLNGKQTLVMRPMDRLTKSPHLLSGWLSAAMESFRFEGERVVWLDNPVDVLADLYCFLNMDNEDDPAAYIIWDGDRDFLDRARRFYQEARERLGMPAGARDFAALDAKLRNPATPDGFDDELWLSVRECHHGWQLGLEALGILPQIGRRTGFWDLRVEPDLSITIPERLTDPKLHAEMKRVLAPPPAVRADAIVAISGGMFYAQEAPDLPAFVEAGDHFDAGQPLYIIEIMKMFNKVYAPFAGTVDEVLIPGGAGTIVAKGQPLFAVTPDEPLVQEDPVAVRKARQQAARAYVELLYA